MATKAQTSTPTKSPTPLPTATPTATATPTKTLLVLPGTPLPPPAAAINVENASQVSALTEWQTAPVTDLAWAPGGQILALANQTTIDLYDITRPEKLRSLHPRAEGTVNIAISPNGAWLVSGSRRGSDRDGYYSTLELWLGPNWKPMGILYDVPRSLSGMDFSADSGTFVTAYASPVSEENYVAIWNVASWAIAEILEPGAALDVAISKDNNLLAVSPDRYAISIWDLIEGGWLYTLPTSFTGAVQEIAFSPDKVTLASGHYDGAIRLWDTLTGNLVFTMMTEEVIQSLAFSPDGSLLATGGSFQNNLIRIWDTRSGALLHTLEGHTQAVEHLSFSPNSAYLVSATYDGVVRIWGIRP